MATRTHHKIEVLPKSQWIKDEECTNCMVCKEEFTFFNRKHHCRCCGSVVCETCSASRLPFYPSLRICTDCYGRYTNPPSQQSVELATSRKNHLQSLTSSLTPVTQGPKPVLPKEDDQKPYSAEDSSLKKISRAALNLGKQLGHGCYGVVLGGSWNKVVNDRSESVRVAVKGYPRAFVTEDLIIRFIEEAESLASVQHPNIISVYGMCIEPEILIVTEWLRYGSLDIFLRRCNPLTLAPYMSLKSGELLNLSLQLADVMCFLEAHNILHRDLAARSVLVGENPTQPNALVVKLADFGLMRSLIEQDYYKMRQMLPLPFKWMAPEIYKRRDFNVEAMVWSFGVLLWEIYSYGEMPFRKYTVAETKVAVEHNERLEKPAACPSGIFKIMFSCWNRRPEERPYFSQIKSQLLAAASSTSASDTPSTPSSRSESPVGDQQHISSSSLASAGARISSKAALGRVVFPTSRGANANARYLIGREKEMSHLRDLFFSSAAKSADVKRRVVGVIGFSGVGKTCTAQQYAHHNSQAYPGGIYYIHAKSIATIQVDMRRIALQELGKPELLYADAGTIYEAVMSYFNNNAGWLIILDNVDDLEVLRKMPLFPRETANGHVLLTSRATGTELDEIKVDYVVTLAPLKLEIACAVFWNYLYSHAFISTQDAIASFEHVLGEPEKAAVRELLGDKKGVAGLPLAISQIASTLVAHQYSVEEYSAILTKVLSDVNSEYALSKSGVDMEVLLSWSAHYHFTEYINAESITAAGVKTAETFSRLGPESLTQKFKIPEELVARVTKAQSTVQDFDTEISISRSSIEAIWNTNSEYLKSQIPAGGELLCLLSLFGTHDVPVSVVEAAIHTLGSGPLYSAVFDKQATESPLVALSELILSLLHMGLICFSDSQPSIKTSSLSIFRMGDTEASHPILLRTISLHRLVHMMLARVVKSKEAELEEYLFASIRAFSKSLPEASVNFEEAFVSSSNLLPIAGSLAQSYFRMGLDKVLREAGGDHGHENTVAVGSLLHFVGYWMINLPILSSELGLSLDQLLEISVISTTRFPEAKMHVRNILLTRALCCFEQDMFVKAAELAEEVVRIDEEMFPGQESPNLLLLSWVQLHSGLGFSEASETAEHMIASARVDTEAGRHTRRDFWFVKLTASLLQGHCRSALEKWPLHVSTEVNRLGMGRESIDVSHPGAALYAIFLFWCGEKDQAREVQQAIERLENSPSHAASASFAHSKYDRMLFACDTFKEWVAAMLQVPLLVLQKEYERAISEIKPLLDSKSKLVKIQALACLISVYLQQGRHEEGMEVHREIMELCGQMPSSPWIAMSLLSVADLLCVFQEYASASEIYRRVISIYDSFGQMDGSKTGLFYAMGLTGLGRVTEAFLDLLVDSKNLSHVVVTEEGTHGDGAGSTQTAPKPDMGLYSQALPSLERELSPSHALLSWIKVKTSEAMNPPNELLASDEEGDGNYVVLEPSVMSPGMP